MEKAIKDGKKNTVLSINKISITEERKKKYDFSVPYMINKYVILKLNNRTDITEETIFNKPYKIAITESSLYVAMAKKLDINKTFTYSYTIITMNYVRML